MGRVKVAQAEAKEATMKIHQHLGKMTENPGIDALYGQEC